MLSDNETETLSSSQAGYEELWEAQQKNPPKPKEHFVFVYGSLIEGFGNHQRLGGSPLVLDGAVAIY